jgi:hypothetical protein
MILRSINVFNVLLLSAIVAFATYILPPLLNAKVTYTPPAAKKLTTEEAEKPVAVQPPSVMEYVVIAEQNVFNPERKIPAEKKDEKPLPKPEFVLYGTLIADDTRMAFLDDLKAPYTSLGRGKRQRTLRIGSNLSGYTLSEVYPDRVVMVRGEDRMELRVIDASKAKTRDTGSGPAGTASAAQQPPAGGAQRSDAVAAQRSGRTSPPAIRSSRGAQRQQAAPSRPRVEAPDE